MAEFDRGRAAATLVGRADGSTFLVVQERQIDGAWERSTGVFARRTDIDQRPRFPKDFRAIVRKAPRHNVASYGIASSLIRSPALKAARCSSRMGKVWRCRLSDRACSIASCWMAIARSKSPFAAYAAAQVSR